MIATKSTTKPSSLIFLCVMALLGHGCSSNSTTVVGHVQYEDKTPVKGGTITFNSSDKNTNATGVIAVDGTFALTSNPVPGSYKVVVVGGGDVYGAPPTVDEVYGSPLETPLTQEVVAGRNDLTITVKRPASKRR